MSRFARWLEHRREVVGFATWKDLSDYCGLSEQSLGDTLGCGSLEPLNRSARRLLSAALRVSLRSLEWFDSGHIDWIGDNHVIDLEGRGRPHPGQENDCTGWTVKAAAPEDRGTPLLGRIRPGGQAEVDEDWQDESRRRLPARFGNGYDVYALEVEGEGHALIFRNFPPWEFREGLAIIYCWNGCEAAGWFGRLQLMSLKARLVTPDGQCREMEPVNILRIGKVVGRWPVADNTHL